MIKALLLTMLCGLAGGLLLSRLKMPGGMMVGAIIGSMAYAILSGDAYMPSEAKFAAQLVAGAFIGSGIEKEDILHMPKIIKPMGIVILCLLITNIAVGVVIYLVSPLDLLTALMSCVPGGMSDIPIIAADMGGDAGKIAVLQFVRMAAGIGVFPSLILMVDKRAGDKRDEEGEAAKRQQSSPKTIPVFLVTLAVSFLGGLVGRFLGIPAGVLVFSMLAVVALKMVKGWGYLPTWARKCAQVLSGAYIGCTMTMDDVSQMKHLIVPAAIILAGFFLNCFLCGRLLQKLFGFERKMSMLAATPAGASDMALISADIGVSNPDLSVMQILRLVAVILIFPQVIALIVKVFT